VHRAFHHDQLPHVASDCVTVTAATDALDVARDENDVDWPEDKPTKYWLNAVAGTVWATFFKAQEHIPSVELF